MKYYIGEQNLRVEEESFAEKVSILLVVREEAEEKIRAELMELSAGRIGIEVCSYGDFAV